MLRVRIWNQKEGYDEEIILEEEMEGEVMVVSQDGAVSVLRKKAEL